MRWMIAAVLIVAGLASVPTPAFAEVVCHNETRTEIDQFGNVITRVVQVCEETGSGDGGSGGGGGSGKCVYDGREIPCTKDGLVWIASRGCYAMNVTDWFKHGEPEWQGHTVGSLWNCMGSGPDQMPGISEIFWLATGDGPTVVDPRVLAEEAFAQMQLATPSIHMAPSPPEKTYVGLDTWLWMGQSQWQTLTRSASAGATSVEVTAKVVSARWDMGEGTKGCPSAGRPWVKGMPDSASTDCSYKFSKVSDFEPNKEFKVGVHLVYQVDWECSGVCLVGSGTLGQHNGPTAGSSIRVGERQTVVIR